MSHLQRINSYSESRDNESESSVSSLHLSSLGSDSLSHLQRANSYSESESESESSDDESQPRQDRRRNDDTDDEDEEEEYPRPVVNRIKYISDGLNENDYKQSNVVNNGLVKSDCCFKFFTKEGYMHQTKYGLKIQGINTCIHCYVSFNSHKFIECLDMIQQEEECLRYYINTFTEEHQAIKCTRTSYGGQCVLCNAIRGIYPPLIRKDKEKEMNLLIKDDTNSNNDFDNVLIFDKTLNSKNLSFVLVL